MSPILNLPSQRFGRLTTMSYVKGGRWLCQCDCGQQKIIRSVSLNNGDTESCGCLQRVTTSVRHSTHGMKETPEYKAWTEAKGRCTRTNSECWENYGGRGIAMSAEWLNNFPAFLAYVGTRPSPEHSIDRYPNNDGNYEPGNVRWATKQQQATNRRSNRLINIAGEKICFADALRKYGVSKSAAYGRLSRGWSLERAFGLVS